MRSNPSMSIRWKTIHEKASGWKRCQICCRQPVACLKFRSWLKRGLLAVCCPEQVSQVDMRKCGFMNLVAICTVYLQTAACWQRHDAQSRGRNDDQYSHELPAATEKYRFKPWKFGMWASAENKFGWLRESRLKGGSQSWWRKVCPQEYTVWPLAFLQNPGRGCLSTGFGLDKDKGLVAVGQVGQEF